MPLSLLIAIVAAPALLGTQEAIRQSQQKEKREEHRARRCNLIATCIKSSLRAREINGRPLVLRDGKIYIDTGTSDGQPYGHTYAGYYLPYPDSDYEGLVTTITDVAPIMNWVYVDKETYELKYGVRADSQANLTGPFDCTRQDRRLTFEGWEGFCAVEEFPALWAVYVDRDDNGLKGKIPMGTRVLEIELARKEKRWKKEVKARTEDQTTNREKALDAEGKEVIREPEGVRNPYDKQPGAQPALAADQGNNSELPKLSTQMSNMSLRGGANSPTSITSAMDGYGASSIFSVNEDERRFFTTPASSVNGEDLGEPFIQVAKGRSQTPPLSTVREEFAGGDQNNTGNAPQTIDLNLSQTMTSSFSISRSDPSAPVQMETSQTITTTVDGVEVTTDAASTEAAAEAPKPQITRLGSVRDAVFGAFRRGPAPPKPAGNLPSEPSG